MKFEELIGKTVPIRIPLMHETDLLEVIIRGVDYGGLWVESEIITQGVLKGLGIAAGNTPAFFIPYHSIRFAYYPLDKTALSESAFGV